MYAHAHISAIFTQKWHFFLRYRSHHFFRAKPSNFSMCSKIMQTDRGANDDHRHTSKQHSCMYASLQSKSSDSSISKSCPTNTLWNLIYKLYIQACVHTHRQACSLIPVSHNSSHIANCLFNIRIGLRVPVWLVQETLLTESCMLQIDICWSITWQ
jgi:hypothetical protein